MRVLGARTWGDAVHILAAVVVLLGTAASVQASDGVRVEGELYPVYGSHNIGGNPLTREFCAAASEYYAADGLDVDGEWIKLEVTIPFTGYYELIMDYQSFYGDPVELDVRIEDCPEEGETTTSRFTLSEGYGFG